MNSHVLWWKKYYAVVDAVLSNQSSIYPLMASHTWKGSDFNGKVGTHEFLAGWDFVLSNEIDSVCGADAAIEYIPKITKFVTYCSTP